MSITTVNTVLERFLTQSNSAVLALKGAWGVGKTHAWMRIVERVGQRITPKSYSYVSLFGMSSLADLRTAILANSRPVDTLGQSITFDVINRQWMSLGLAKVSALWHRLSSAKGGQLLKGVNVAFEVLAPLLMHDMLVCLDDFERLSTQRVSHEELLGFVATLKEIGNCKVVLIFNDAKLPSGGNVYATYREKVVDIELQFNPSAEDAVTWGLPSALWQRDRLKECALALDVKNVRVLRKISDVVTLLEPILRPLHQRVTEIAIRSAVLLTWCYFDTSGSAPPMSFLRSWNTITAELKKKKEKPTAEELKWDRTISGYRFEPFDDIDLAISQVIERGYTEDSGFAEEAAKLDAIHRAGDQEQDFIAAWELFRNSFDSNEEQVVAGLRDGLMKAVMQVTPVNLSGTAALLRQLGHDDVANQLIEYYTRRRADEPELFDLSRNPFSDHITDVPTRERFEAQASTLAKAVPLRKAVETMATGQGYAIEDQRALEAATADELYQLFKGELSVPLHKAVQACLRYSHPPAGNLDQQSAETVIDRTEQALRRIAAESHINAVRVRRHGIEPASLAGPGGADNPPE